MYWAIRGSSEGLSPLIFAVDGEKRVKSVFDGASPRQKHLKPSIATRGKRATIQALLRGLAPTKAGQGPLR